MLGIHPSVSTFVPMRNTAGMPRTVAMTVSQASFNQSSSSSSSSVGTGLEVVSPIRPHADPSISFDFEPVLEKMSVAKPVHRVADPKFKTIVCVHWYNGLCMKGDNCEFLHEMDMDRMPECRAGERCTDKLCPFKHLKAEERPICNNYNLGFCQHGLTCRFQHRKRPPEELALVCDYANIIHIPRDREHGQDGFNVVNMGGGGSNQQHGESNEGLINPNPALTRQQNIRRQLNYRTALCNSFSKTGTCTYGDNCDYAHSEEERQRNINLRNQALPNRQIPAGVVAPQNVPGQPMPKRALASPLDRIVLDLREWTDADGIDAIYATPLALPPPAGERLPVSIDDYPRYFVLRSADYEYLARSVVSNRWLVHPSFVGPFNAAFDSNSQVFFFFAVDGEEGCFGGVARMKSHFIIKPNNDSSRCETAATELPEVAEGTIEWLRVNELPYKKTAYLTAVDPIVQRELPVALCIEGQELPPSVGRCLMTMSYRETAIHLDGESVTDNVALAVHPFGPSPEVDSAFRESPPGPPESPPPNVNVPPGSVWAKTDGYVVAIASQPLFYESMQRQMFGLASLDATAALDIIRPGTIVLAYTPYDGRLHGVFEAISALELNWDPLAFSNSPPANNQRPKSQFPMQFRFRTILPCGPLHENALVLAFRHRAGVYRTDELQPLINLFATKTKQGEIQPALKSAAIESVERGMPPPLVVPKGISFGEPLSLPGGGLWKQSCMVNIDFDPRFKAPNRLIGKNGMNMQMVKEKSGCNRAKVFAGDEAPAEGVMEIVFEAPTKESLDEAVRLTKELLDELLGQWEEYKERGIRMKMERQGMMPGGGPPQGNIPGGSGPPPPRGMPPFPPQNNHPGGFRGGPPPTGMMMTADPNGMMPPPHDMSMPPSFPPPQGGGGPRGPPGGFMMPPRGGGGGPPPSNFVPRGPPPSMMGGPPPSLQPRQASHPQQQPPPPSAVPESSRRGDIGGEDRQQSRSASVPTRDDDKRRGGPSGGGGRRRSPSPSTSRRRRSPSPVAAGGGGGGRSRGGGGGGRGGGGERKDSRDRHRKRDRSRDRGGGGGGTDKRRRRN